MPLRVAWTSGERRTPRYQVEGDYALSSIVTLNNSTSTATVETAPEGTTLVSVYAEEACYVQIGPSASAAKPVGTGTAASRFLGAGERRVFYATPGDKIAGILDA